MKRKNEKVPEFDEIIFEKRNKQYGAYNLRKGYKSVTSLSILGGIAVSTILVTALSFTTPKETTHHTGIDISVHMTDPLITKVAATPLPIIPPKLGAGLKNLKPVVVSDTNLIITMAATDVVLSTITDRKVTDNQQDSVISTPEIPKEDQVFIKVEEDPQFPGGEQALMKFIGENLKYPEEAQINRIQGKVILKFVVNPDGSVDRIEIMRGIDPVLDNEAMRVVGTLPKFRPGKQGGVPVKVWFMLPINFKIQN